jgi:hypothetical protein
MTVATINHRPTPARAKSVKDTVVSALDEAFCSLEESVQGLTDEQLWAEPLSGRPGIARRFIHALDNLVGHAYYWHTERLPWETPPFDLGREQNLDQPPSARPALTELRDLLHQARQKVFELLETMSEDDLLRAPYRQGKWFDFFRANDRNCAEQFSRTAYHTAAHVRQIWLLRGALGLTDKEGWPRQIHC